MCAGMYNACLESWRGTYSWWKEHHDPQTEKFPSELPQSKYDLMTQFTGVREDIAEWNRLSVRVGRGVICRFDRARAAFYRRCKEGRKPRVSAFQAFAPLAFHRDTRSDPVYGSVRPVPERTPPIDGGDCTSKACLSCGSPTGATAFTTALGLGGEVAELRVVRTPLRTEVHVVVKHPERPMAEKEPQHLVGIDLRLHTRLHTSDGQSLPARVVNRSAIRKTQRKVSRSKKGSLSRRKKVVRSCQGVAQRKGTSPTSRLAHQLVSACDGVAVEDLNVSGMLRSTRFSKKMSEQR